jgi:hypothetical protein
MSRFDNKVDVSTRTAEGEFGSRRKELGDVEYDSIRESSKRRGFECIWPGLRFSALEELEK